MEEKVNRDQATAEVTRWMDAKKMSAKKREANEANIETLVDAIVEGNLSLKDGNVLSQKLRFPIETTEGKVAYDTLDYKPRLDLHGIHIHLQGVKPTDMDSRLCAYVAALTSKPKDIIKKLDTEDYSIAQAIAVFFA